MITKDGSIPEEPAHLFWGSSFNHGTTQTALDPLGRGAVRTHRTNTSHVATIFCNHLVKLLQKMVASQKKQRGTCNYE